MIALLFAPQAAFSLEFDTTFRVPEFENNGGSVSDVIINPDRSSILVGAFTSWDTIPRNNIVRLSPNGEVDTDFIADVNGVIKAIKRTSNGKFFIAGDFTEVNGTARFSVARLNFDGSLDLSFAPIESRAYQDVEDIEPMPNGGLLMAGRLFYLSESNTRAVLFALTSTGTVDSRFLSVAAGSRFRSINDVTRLANNQLLVAGTFETLNGHSSAGIARILSNGQVDTSFTSGLLPIGTQTIRGQKVLLDNQQKILVTGRFYLPGDASAGRAARLIARLNSDGSVDEDFEVSVESNLTSVEALLIDTQGRLILGGQFNGVDNTTDLRPDLTLVRFNASGTYDDAFAPPITDTLISAIALDRNDSLLVAGQRRRASFSGAPNESGRTVRVLANGALDQSFLNAGIMTAQPDSPGGRRSFIYDIAESTNGSLYVGGGFARVNGVVQPNLVRLDKNGNVDLGFRPEIDSEVRNLIALPNGKLIIYEGSRDTFTLQRLNADGSVDTRFNPEGISDRFVSDIERQKDGKLIIVQPDKISRLNNNGSVDTSFNSTVEALGATIASLQADGKLVIASSNARTSAGQLYSARLIRLNTDGSLDAQFNPTIESSDLTTIFYDIALSNRSELAIVGNFETVNGISKPGFAILDSNGVLIDTPPLAFGRDAVFSVNFQCDGRLILGGDFDTINGVRLENTARLNADYGLESDFVFPEALPISPVQFARPKLITTDGRIIMTGSLTQFRTFLGRFTDTQNEELPCYQDDDLLCVVIPKKATFCL